MLSLLAFYPISTLRYSISPNSTISIFMVTDVVFHNADNHFLLEILSFLGIRLKQNSTTGTYRNLPFFPELHFDATLSLSNSNSSPFFFKVQQLPLDNTGGKSESTHTSLTHESSSISTSLRIKCEFKTSGLHDC